MESENPLVSIVVPVFNAEQTLEACVSSIIGSIAEHKLVCSYELLLVEDCSTDSSAMIAARLAEGLPFCRVVRHDANLGLAQARNTGIRESRGEYIVWVDSDDLVSLDWFESIVSALNKNNGKPDVVAFDFVKRFPDGRLEPNYYGEKRLLLKELGILHNPAHWVRDVLRSLQTFSFTVTKVFRRQLLLEFMFDAPRGALEDMGFMLSAAPAIKNVYYIPKQLYIYCISDEGLVGTLNTSRRLLHVRYAIEKIKKLPFAFKIAAMVSIAQILIEVRRASLLSHDEKPGRESMKYMRKAIPYVLMDTALPYKAKVVYLLSAFPFFTHFLKKMWRIT